MPSFFAFTFLASQSIIIHRFYRQNEEMYKKIKDEKTMSLPSLSQVQDDTLQGECVICLHDFSSPLVRLSCGHVFHKDCIDNWYTYKYTCPICRTPLK